MDSIASAWWRRHRTSGWLRRGLLIVGAMALVACTSATALPYPQLMADLCAKNVGWKIYRTVDNVRGYYLAGHPLFGGGRGCPHLNAGNFCVSALLSYGFSYVESKVDIIGDSSVQLMVDAPGLHEFTLQKTGHPDCRIFQKALAWWTKDELDKKSFYQGDKEKFHDYCIASKLISALKSIYQVYSSISDIDTDNGKIVEFIYAISEIKKPTNILAKYTSYSFIPGPTWHTQFGVSCPRDAGMAPFDGIRNILRPSTLRGAVAPS